MNTEKCFRVAVGAAGLVFAMFFTGCGGGDGGGSNQVAPNALQGQSYNFSPNTGGQTAVTFTSPSNYTFQHETGAVEQGTYQSTRDGNVWTVTLLNTNGGQQVYNMNFSSSSSGSFVLHREGEVDRFGPFSARSTPISSGDIDNGNVTTTGNTTGTDSGSTTTDTGSTTSGTDTGSTTGTDTGTTSGTSSGSTTDGTITPSTDYTGNAPVSVAGRTMFGTRTFTSTGPTGQTHTYTFGNGTFHDSDAPEEADGTFQYNASPSAANLTLNYTSPIGFSGDKHVINMNFTSKDKGTFQSTYTRADGTEIVINGDFEFQPIQ